MHVHTHVETNSHDDDNYSTRMSAGHVLGLPPMLAHMPDMYITPENGECLGKNFNGMVGALGPSKTVHMTPTCSKGHEVEMLNPPLSC